MWIHLKGDRSAGIFAEMLLKIVDGNFSKLKGMITIFSNLGIVVNFLTYRRYPSCVTTDRHTRVQRSPIIASM